jgi:hypothetical protein
MKLKTFAAVTLFVLLINSMLAFRQSGITNNIDGSTYSLVMKKTSGKRIGWDWTSDEISFRHGTIKSKVMSYHEHFPDAVCAFITDSADHAVHFNASSKNPGGSEILWNGTVNGNKISGVAIWKNMQGTQEYSFSGMLK